MTTIGTVEGTLRLTDEFTATLVKAQTQMQQAGKNAVAMGQAMTQVGSTLTKTITLPLAALSGVAIKSFSDFDAAMTQSTAIMGDLSDVMRNDMVAAAKEVALATSFSAKEAAESFFFLASAGLDAEASIAALPSVAQFAQAGMFDMATATDLLTDAQSALGLVIKDDAVANMENMVRVSDVLVKANTLANASVQQFSEALTSEAGAALKTFNIDIEEGVAVLAAFADQGIKGQVAGSSLSRILRLMTSSAVKNKEAFEELNVEVFDSRGNVNNLADIIGDMEGALSDLSDEARIAALEQLGFKARVQGVILPLLGSSAAMREFEKAARSSGGITKEIAENQLETFREKMGLLKDRVLDAAITLGEELAGAIESLIPLFNTAIDAIKFAVDLFSALPGPIKGAVFALGLLLAALGPILLIVGALIIAFGQLSIAMSAIPVAKVATSLNATLLPALSRTLTFLSTTTVTGGLMMGLKAIPALALTATSSLIALGVAAAKAAFFFAISPLGLALMAVAAGAALTAFVLKDGGLFENWVATTQKSIKELREGVTDLSGVVGDLGLAIADRFRDSIPQITEAIAAGVNAGKDMNDILGELTSTFEAGTVEGDALRAAMVEVGAEMNSAARATASLEKARLAAVARTEELEAAEKKLVDIISGLSVTTLPGAITKIEELTIAMDSGRVPADQMKTLIDELGKSFKELGLTDIPAVSDALEVLNARFSRTNGILQTAADKALRLSANLKEIPPFVDDIGDGANKASTEWEGFVKEMADTANVVPPIRLASDAIAALGFEIPDVRKEMTDLLLAIEDGRVPAKQLAAAVEEMRARFDRLGVLTPEINRQLEEMSKQTGFSAARFGELFGVIQDAFPSLDGFLGKLKGILGWFKKIGGLLSSVSSKFGDFFGKLPGLLGGGGGGGIPGLGGIKDLIGGITGLFGSAGTAAATALSTSLTTGVGIAFETGLPALVPSLTGAGATAGTAAGTGIISGISGAISSGASAVGGALTAIVPLLTNPFTIAIGAAIGGFFLVKKLFGKPNKVELEGRKTAAAFTASMVKMMDATARAEVAIAVVAGGTKQWAQQVVGLKQAFITLGKTEAEAFAISDKLWKAEKKGPEAVTAVIATIQPALDAVTAAMASTGLELTQLQELVKEKSRELGISMAEAFTAIADGTIDTMRKSVDATLAANQAIVDSTSTTVKEVTQIQAEGNAQLIAGAQATSTTMSETLGAGFRSLEDTLAGVAETGARSFRFISDAARESAREAIDAFRDMEDELVGESVFPDTAAAASADLMLIGAAAEEAAKRSEQAFRSAALSITGRAPGMPIAGAAPTTTALAGIAGRQPFDSFDRGGALVREMGRMVAGGDQTINLVVDGQVLAKTVIRNTSRSLANSGLNQRTR